jgi:hypothetical protein
MYLTKEEREELSQLSKEVFGTRNQWQKIINDGNMELLTKNTVEIIPGENGAPSTTKEITVPILSENGHKQFVTKYYTPESAKEYMLTIKKQRDEIVDMINKQNEERKLKAEQEKALKDVNESGGGSAL